MKCFLLGSVRACATLGLSVAAHARASVEPAISAAPDYRER